MRLFIAIWLPEDVRNVLGQEAADFRKAAAQARFGRTDGLHITLAFLGDRPAPECARLDESLAPVCRAVRPCTLEVGPPGCFPPQGEPHVLWYGVHDSEQALGALQREIVQALQSLEIPGDYQRFTPHITMARLRASRGTPPARNIRERWSTLPVPASNPFVVRSVWLMQSISAPGGAVYTGLTEWPLNSAR